MYKAELKLPRKPGQRGQLKKRTIVSKKKNTRKNNQIIIATFNGKNVKNRRKLFRTGRSFQKNENRNLRISRGKEEKRKNIGNEK